MGMSGCVQKTSKPENVNYQLGNEDRLPPSEWVVPEIIAKPENFSGGLAFSSSGELFVANFLGEGNIGKLKLDTDAKKEIFINLKEWVSSSDEFSVRAEGLYIDSEDRLLVADAGTGKLLRISPEANKLEVLADSYDGYRFESVKDLTMAPNGDLFVSSPHSGTIYRIRPDIGYVGILNDDLVRGDGLAISPDGKQLIVTEPEASRVVVYDIPKDLILVDSWTLVDFSPSGIEPRGVSFDDLGRLFVALGNRNEVRAFDLDLGIELVRYKIDTEAENIVFRNGSIYVGGSESITRIRLHR
ncbi:MAG: hypothetical protein CMI23_00180 [Opitutae bacterium]|nr:hypothetical protein [Opitutae bacterium]|tara:strand:- start:3677 stop:4576 length:900 start_codon:yes stop_codon:yes gene_type:complete